MSLQPCELVRKFSVSKYIQYSLELFENNFPQFQLTLTSLINSLCVPVSTLMVTSAKVFKISVISTDHSASAGYSR